MEHTVLLDKLRSWRRDLHAIPEIGTKEFKTSAYVKAALESTRPDAALQLADTGWKFVYKSNKENAKAIAFRADMDALPVTENSIYPYPSQHPGMMHACGHDGHMASLIALGHIAAELRDAGALPVDVVLLFQPAEEGIGGAERMIAQGALEDPYVEYVFGFHLMPQVQNGVIALSPGGVMAGNTEFNLLFTGARAHGAMPHLGSDAAAAMCSTYLMLQTHMTRAVPPNAPAVLTFGHVAAGNMRNVVAEKAEMQGILRTYNNAMQEKLIEDFQRIAANVSEPFGVTTAYEKHCFFPAVVNDAELVEKVRPLIPVSCDQESLLTAEDFSFFAIARPGVYAFVGCKDETRTAPLHSDQFDFDETALLPAIEWYHNIITSYAKED